MHFHEQIKLVDMVPNKPEMVNIRNPIVFDIPNKLFPQEQYKSIYESNCVEFWKYITQKEVPNVEENRYMISSAGHTWDFKFNRRIGYTCSVGSKFYVQLTLQSPNRDIIIVKMHRLMMILFNPIPDSHLYQVNHKDTIHHHNDLSNLEWCDDAYNRYHGIVNGAGSNIFNFQINTFDLNDLKNIKNMRENEHFTYKQIAEKINENRDHKIDRKTISRIATGKSKLYSEIYDAIEL